jgi:hypothetical protein
MKIAKNKAPKEVSSMAVTCNGLDVMLRRNKIGVGLRKVFGKSRRT